VSLLKRGGVGVGGASSEHLRNPRVVSIEEGRAASKSPPLKLAFYVQQAVSAGIIPNSAVGIFPPKTEETKT
jgi:hypothetical protein